jgi:uncharacterized protein
MKNQFARVVLVLSLVAAPAGALAQDLSESERLVVTSEAFLSAHPDLKYRLEGLDALEKGRHSQAMGYFKRAARYSDKPSQGMLGEMYWAGIGVAQDRVMGYIWMDVAAERGFPVMVAKREAYWNALDPEQRLAVVELGMPVMDEYGDAAAKPRLAKLIERGARNVTGSRVGHVGNLVIQIPGPTGFREVRGTDYYSPTLWDPEQYSAWLDQDWKSPPKGEVDVGEAISVDPPPRD